VRTQSNVVLVPALVRNAKGELVFTLKAGDFRVTDDGIEQALTFWTKIRGASRWRWWWPSRPAARAAASWKAIAISPR
jgi:hypothetical protein